MGVKNWLKISEEIYDQLTSIDGYRFGSKANLSKHWQAIEHIFERNSTEITNKMKEKKVLVSTCLKEEPYLLKAIKDAVCGENLSKLPEMTPTPVMLGLPSKMTSITPRQAHSFWIAKSIYARFGNPKIKVDVSPTEKAAKNQTETEDADSIKFKALFIDDDNAIGFMEYVSKTILTFGVFGEVRDEFEKVCKIANSSSFSAEAGKDMDKIRKGLINFCLHHRRIYLAWTEIKRLKTLYPEKDAEVEKENEKKQKFSIGDTLTNPQAAAILQEISEKFSDQNQLKSFWYYIRSIPLDNSNNRYSDDEIAEAVEISGHMSLTDVTRFAFNHYDIYGVWETFTEQLKTHLTNPASMLGKMDPANPMNMIGKIGFAEDAAQQFHQYQTLSHILSAVSCIGISINQINENLSKIVGSKKTEETNKND